VIPRCRLLDSLYRHTGSEVIVGPAVLGSIEQVAAWFTTAASDVVTVPTGCTIFPREVPRPSRRWAARRFVPGIRPVHLALTARSREAVDIRYWGDPVRGGHFGAREQPKVRSSRRSEPGQQYCQQYCRTAASR
jgi:hypothetical protein